MGVVASTVASCGGLGRSRSPPPSPKQKQKPSGRTPTPSKGPEPDLARVFRRFDANGDGRICPAEMREAVGCTAEEADLMVAAADLDGDGFLSMEELRTLLESGEQDNELRAAFAEYDEDGDGVITPEELRRMLRRLGLAEKDLTVELCAEMVAAVDSNGDGVISFDEFKAMSTGTKWA